MYEYTKSEKSTNDKEKLNLSEIDALRNRKSSRKETAGYSFNDVRIQRKQASLLPLQALASFQEIGDNMKSARVFGAKNVVQLKQDVDCNRNVVQFTVKGTDKTRWLDEHNFLGKKRDLFKDFFDMVHQQSDFIFFADELDSYCEQYKTKNYSEISRSDLMNFDLFKKHVVMMRDPEGAHGAQRHTHEAGAGNQYIVDRVLEPRGPQKASYLPVDTYLNWDNTLIMNHEDIFDKYMELANNLVSELLGYSGQCNNDIENMKVFAEGLGEMEDISIGGGEILTLTVYADSSNIWMKEGDLHIRIKASVISNRQVQSFSITKRDAEAKGTSGVKAGTKRPEAHTGNLSPEFIVKDGFDNDISLDMLKWVTKY